MQPFVQQFYSSSHFRFKWPQRKRTKCFLWHQDLGEKNAGFKVSTVSEAEKNEYLQHRYIKYLQLHIELKIVSSWRAYKHWHRGNRSLNYNSTTIGWVNSLYMQQYITQSFASLLFVGSNHFHIVFHSFYFIKLRLLEIITQVVI
jgi:hypothetical protein